MSCAQDWRKQNNNNNKVQIKSKSTWWTFIMNASLHVKRYYASKGVVPSFKVALCGEVEECWETSQAGIHLFTFVCPALNWPTLSPYLCQNKPHHPSPRSSTFSCQMSFNLADIYSHHIRESPSCGCFKQRGQSSQDSNCFAELRLHYQLHWASSGDDTVQSQHCCLQFYKIPQLIAQTVWQTKSGCPILMGCGDL